MIKEELKNKYSAFITEISETLGLGKPVDILKLCATTDLFFQPLEKCIAELKQENKVLTQNLEDTEIVNNALEKEIAELKGLVNQYKASKCGSISLVNRNMIMFDQLTKAKEIIKNLMVYVPVDLKEYEEAKQFLIEVENV